MKQVLLIIFTFSTIFSFSQEKLLPFVNPTETRPRFIEDSELTERENSKSFKKKIKNHFDKYLSKLPFLDSIKGRTFFSFRIDTLGNSSYSKILPKKRETIFLKKEFSRVIDLLPKFIPATQSNKKVSIFYSIVVSRNE